MATYNRTDIVPKILDNKENLFKDKAVYKYGDYQWTVENDYCYFQDKKKHKNTAACAVDVWNDAQRGLLTAEHLYCYGSLRSVIHLPTYTEQCYSVYLNSDKSYKIVTETNTEIVDFQIFDNTLLWSTHSTFYFPYKLPFGYPLFDRKQTQLVGFVGHLTEDNLYSILAPTQTKQMIVLDANNYISIHVSRLNSLERESSIYGNTFSPMNTKQYWDNHKSISESTKNKSIQRINFVLSHSFLTITCANGSEDEALQLYYERREYKNRNIVVHQNMINRFLEEQVTNNDNTNNTTTANTLTKQHKLKGLLRILPKQFRNDSAPITNTAVNTQ